MRRGRELRNTGWIVTVAVLLLSGCASVAQSASPLAPTMTTQTEVAPTRTIAPTDAPDSFKLVVLNDTYESLELYRPTVDSWGILSRVSLDGSVFTITAADITNYDWTQQSMALSEAATQRLLAAFHEPSLPLAPSHQAFVVTLDGERLYGGVFLLPASAIATKFPVIYVDQEEHHFVFRLRPAQSSKLIDQSNWGAIRSTRIHDFFLRQGKLST